MIDGGSLQHGTESVSLDVMKSAKAFESDRERIENIVEMIKEGSGLNNHADVGFA